MRINNKNGISLVEVIVAAVIFVIAAFGMFSTLSMMRVSSDATDERLQAAYFGRQILEELRAKVDQRAFCATTGDFINDLSVGVHNYPDPGGQFTSQYNVTEDPITHVRRVDLTIQW